VIFVEDLFLAENSHILGLRLRDQHAIEWVFVRSRQQPRALPVFDANREFPKTEPFDSQGKVGSEHFRTGNLPIRTFVATSHADAALTYTSVLNEETIERAFRESFGSSVAHQISGCVSSRTSRG
jgi:hypothetical protein